MSVHSAAPSLTLCLPLPLSSLGASLYDNVVQAGFASWRQSQSVLSVYRRSKPPHCITP